MSNTVFSKFYKIKETQATLESDVDFLTMEIGTIIQKNTGEEYKKVDVNVFDKTIRDFYSVEEADGRFARLHFENSFTEDNYFNKDIHILGTTESTNLNVTNNATIKNGTITTLTCDNATVKNKITSKNGQITNLIINTSCNPKTSNTGTLGSSNAKWATAYINEMYGTAQSARYSDLAEKYTSDLEYEEGTVVEINENGNSQITRFNFGTLAGVISKKPGFKLNSDQLEGQYVCLKGMVPVLCNGAIKKGQFCVAIQGGVVKGIYKKDMTLNDYLNKVGVALEDSKNGKVLVKV